MLCYSGVIRSCKDCTDRRLGCHAVCEKYISETEELAKKKKEFINNMEKYYKSQSKKKDKRIPYNTLFTYR